MATFVDDFSNPANLSLYQKFDQQQVDSYKIANGHLEIAASPKQDLWEGQYKRGAPLLLIDPVTSGDNVYEVQAIVTAASTNGPQAVNTQVGLFAFWDVRNWVFWGFTNHDFTFDGVRTTFDGLIMTVTCGGSSSIVLQWPSPRDVDSGIFKMIRGLRHYGTGTVTDFTCAFRADRNSPWLFTGNIMGCHFPDPFTVEKVGMGVKTFNLSGAGVENEGLGIFDKFAVGRPGEADV
jgi:hypothetical protein